MTTAARKRVGIPQVEAVLQKYGIEEKDKVIEELRRLPQKRVKAPPPPPGGICLREAARKYGISNPTLSRWANKGLIPIITKTKNWLYVDEKALKIILTSKTLNRRGNHKN